MNAHTKQISYKVSSPNKDQVFVNLYKSDLRSILTQKTHEMYKLAILEIKTLPKNHESKVNSYDKNCF